MDPRLTQQWIRARTDSEATDAVIRMAIEEVSTKHDDRDDWADYHEGRNEDEQD